MGNGAGGRRKGTGTWQRARAIGLGLTVMGLLTGAVGCSDDGDPNAGGPATTSQPQAASSTEGSSSATSTGGKGTEVDEALCDLLQDDRVVELFVSRSGPSTVDHVSVEQLPGKEAQPAGMKGCAVRIDVSLEDGGTSSTTAVLARGSHSGAGPVPVDTGADLTVRWEPMEDEPGMYRATALAPSGGAVVVGDHGYVVLMTDFHFGGGKPIVGDVDVQAMQEASEAEYDRDLLTALRFVADTAG